jgi:broad specificity phosphatase PhoE
VGRTVSLVRHGDRRDFADPSWARSADRPEDPPLSRAGVAQVEALAARLRGAPVEHVFSSPFLRCVETADVLAAALSADLKIEPGLSEWLSREWFPLPPRTRALGDLCARFPRIDPGYAPRGAARHGESGTEALLRSGRTVLRLLADFPGDVLAVGHGASILGSTAALLGVPAGEAEGLLPEIPCASLTRLRSDDARWALDVVCDVAHLEHGAAGVRGPR